MDSALGLAPPAAKHRPRARTTITNITADLLCEIFILLPPLPSLVRAAISCRTFLHAVRSSPAFRRRFQANHPPQLLGFFNEPRDSCKPSARWEIASCQSGYIVLINSTADQIAVYNPLTQALDIFPEPPPVQFTKPGKRWKVDAQDSAIQTRTPTKSTSGQAFYEFHIVFFPEEDQGVLRMISVLPRKMQRQLQACIAVFSSATREWKVLPWVDTPTPPGEEMQFYHGTQANGFVYWRHTKKPYALALNTATLQFSRVDLPSLIGAVDSELFSLGHTKDGKLCICMVAAETGTLAVWFWRADGEKWIFKEDFPLGTCIDVTIGNAIVRIEAVIDGYVYLSAKYDGQPESLLSLCLETGKLNTLFDDTYTSPSDLYIMAWPRSLIRSKEDSETEVTVDRVADDGPVGTEKPPSVLVAALKSYKDALINAVEAKVAEIEAFFTSYPG